MVLLGQRETTKTLYIVLFFTYMGRCGRVVKASDSKSDSLWERRFESCHLRKIFFRLGYTLDSNLILSMVVLVFGSKTN